MKYIDEDIIKELIQNKIDTRLSGKFGFDSVKDHFYYTRSMMMPSGDGYAYVFTDFKVTMWYYPYYGGMSKITQTSALDYINFVMKRLPQERRTQYKKDYEKYKKLKKLNKQSDDEVSPFVYNSI